jgi:hypothetical protein
MSIPSVNRSHYFRTNTANNFGGGADRNNRSSAPDRMKKAVGSIAKGLKRLKPNLGFIGVASAMLGKLNCFSNRPLAQVNYQRPHAQGPRPAPAYAAQETLTANAYSKAVKTNKHRDSEGRPTSKLYGHLFSIAGQGLNSSSISSSLTEMTTLTHKYAEISRSSKPDIAEKYGELSNLFSQAQRWYGNPETALSEIKVSLTDPSEEGASVKSVDEPSLKNQGEIIPGSKALLSIATRGSKEGKSAGHAMQFEITGKANNRLSITVHNTGGGVEHNHAAIAHPDGSTRYSTESDEHGELIPKMYQPYVVYDDIAANDLDEIVNILYSLEQCDIRESAPGKFELFKSALQTERQDIFDKIDQIYSLLSSRGTRQVDAGEFQPPQPDGFCGISTAISFAQHFGDTSISDVEHFKFLHAAREQVIADTLNGIQDADPSTNGGIGEAESQLTIDEALLDDALNILEENESHINKYFP